MQAALLKRTSCLTLQGHRSFSRTLIGPERPMHHGKCTQITVHATHALLLKLAKAAFRCLGPAMQLV
jgi:hypothetical protein